MAKTCANCLTQTDGGELACKKCGTSAFYSVHQPESDSAETLEPEKRKDTWLGLGIGGWAFAIVIGLLISLQPYFSNLGGGAQEENMVESTPDLMLADEFLSPPPPGIGDRIQIDQLEIGDCVSKSDAEQKMSPIENADGYVTLADCDTANVGKIYEMSTWEKGIYWRGDKGMADHLRNMCSYRLEEIYGYPADVFSEIKWGYHWETDSWIWLGSQPTYKAWRDHSDNSVYCIAFEDNFGLIQTPDPTTYEGIAYQRMLDEQR